MRCVVFCLLVLATFAADPGILRGIVHDPQHRPLPGAQIVLTGLLKKTVTSDANGEFQVTDMPEGSYTVAVTAQGFRPFEKQITVTAAKAPVLHLELELATISSSVDVSGATSKLGSNMMLSPAWSASPRMATVKDTSSRDTSAGTPSTTGASLEIVSDPTSGA